MVEQFTTPRLFNTAQFQTCQGALTLEEAILMKKTMLVVLVIWASVLLAQESNAPSGSGQDNSKHAKGQVTVQGCVGRSTGDYILTKQDPGMTYAPPVPGKTSGSNGKRVPVDEHEFRHFGKNRLSGPGDANHHFDQDHRQGVHRTPNLRLVKDGESALFGGMARSMIRRRCFFSLGSSNGVRL
jgi:hypothetical protein